MDADAAAAAAQHADPVEEQHAQVVIAAKYQLVPTERLFAWIMQEVTEGRYCACHVLEVVRAARKPLLKLLLSDVLQDSGDAVMCFEQMTQLGLRTLEVTRQAYVRGRTLSYNMWLSVVFFAARLVSNWIPRLCPQLPLPSRALRYWAVSLLKSHHLCPDHQLRLETLRFVGMWPPGTLEADRKLCLFTGMGVFLNIMVMSPSRLVPEDRRGVLWALGVVLQELHNANFLQRFTTKAAVNIRQLLLGYFEAALARLVHVMFKTAQRVTAMHRRGMLTMAVTMDELENILLVLRLILTMQPHQALYELPGMRLIATTALVTTANCIVNLPAEPGDDDYIALLTRLDDLFMHLPPTSAVKQELQQHYSRSLARVAARMTEVGAIPLFVPRPQPLPAPERAPPGRFLDTVTHRLMVDPVRVTGTGRVMDRTTLVTMLLLKYPQRNLPFTPLPELQQEIQAWR